MQDSLSIVYHLSPKKKVCLSLVVEFNLDSDVFGADFYSLVVVRCSLGCFLCSSSVHTILSQIL